MKLASSSTFHLKFILLAIEPARHLKILTLPLDERCMTIEGSHFAAQRTLRLLTWYPKISQIFIRPICRKHKDGPLGHTASETASQTNHYAHINYVA